MSRTYVWNVFNTTLSGTLLAGTTSGATLASATGLRGPGWVTLEPDSNTKREIIRFETVNGSDIETLTRGLSGSVSGAQDHAAGSAVRVSVYHQQFDDIWTDIEALETHVGSTATADHPEATTSVRGFMSSSDKTKLDGIETGAEVNDPHPDKATHDALLIDAATLDGIDSTGFALNSHTHLLSDLTDHTKANHDSLLIDADTVDGQHASEFFDAASHTKAVHDALNIDADTLDGLNSSAFAQLSSSPTFTGDGTFQGGDVNGAGTLRLRATAGGTDYVSIDSNSIDMIVDNALRGTFTAAGLDMNGENISNAAAISATGDITASGADFIGSGINGTARLRPASSINTMFEASDVTAQEWLRFWVLGTEEMRLSGNRLDIEVDAVWFNGSHPYDNTMSTLRYAGGQMHQSYLSSSRDVKRDIENYDLGKSRFGKLNPVTWFYRDDAPGIDRYAQRDVRHFGLMLEDTEPVLPHVAHHGEVRYDSLLFLQEWLADYLALRRYVLESA